MKYLTEERPEDYEGVWFDHQLQLYATTANRPNLVEALETQVGKQDIAWAFKKRPSKNQILSWYNNRYDVVMFADKKALIMFKLTWDEDVYVDPLADLYKVYKNITWNLTTPSPSLTSTSTQISQKLVQTQAKQRTWSLKNPGNEVRILDYEGTFDKDWLTDISKYRQTDKGSNDENP